jgi:hypothetical protein
MKKIRRHEIDWLRVIAFYSLIIYHAGMFFVPWDWHVKNPTTYEWFETWMAWLSQFRLPLLFLISGIGVYYALGFRTAGQFIGERSRRLLIPLIFGIFVIVPPQIYFERLSQGVEYASYWEFWKTVFDFVIYPDGGNLSWHHLWFLPYIFVYSILALPLFLFLRSDNSLVLKEKISFVFNKPGLIYLLGIPLLVIYYTMSWRFPTTHTLVNDWYNFTYSLSFFLLGFFLVSIPNLWDILEKYRKISLMSSLIPMVILVGFVYGPTFELFEEEAESFFFIYGLLKISFVTTWIFAILGYSRLLLNKPNSLLTYANESVYPFYILHQSITISFAYYMRFWEISVFAKFGLLIIVTFGGCYLLYEFLIKRINILRVLFGLKTQNK